VGMIATICRNHQSDPHGSDRQYPSVANSFKEIHLLSACSLCRALTVLTCEQLSATARHKYASKHFESVRFPLDDVENPVRISASEDFAIEGKVRSEQPSPHDGIHIASISMAE